MTLPSRCSHPLPPEPWKDCPWCWWQQVCDAIYEGYELVLVKL